MLDQKTFFDKYNVRTDFEHSDLEWHTLQAIHEDYRNLNNEIDICMDELEKYIRKHIKNTDANLHSIRFRKKDPEHLIEKIIRKCGKEQLAKYKNINQHNYKEIIRDLIGVRILTLAKEDWEAVHDAIVGMFAFPEYTLAEPPVAYTRYGDRNIFKGKIHTEHTNKGYRSQHYIIKFNKYYCELQVRTLAEEVYGEFDHKVKYPYRDKNNFLRRYTNTLSQLLASVDELISTCFQMKNEGWEQNDLYYTEDEYIDWKKISLPIPVTSKDNEKSVSDTTSEKIELATYANNLILRKD